MLPRGGSAEPTTASCASHLLCLGLAVALHRQGQRQQQDGHGEPQERRPGAGRARRGLVGARVAGVGVGELCRDGGGVDLADAVLRHHLLGGVAVADVHEVGRRVLAGAREQDLVAAGVLLHERRDVVHLAGDDEPAILPDVVLPHLLERVHLPSRHRDVPGSLDRGPDRESFRS